MTDHTSQPLLAVAVTSATVIGATLIGYALLRTAAAVPSGAVLALAVGSGAAATAALVRWAQRHGGTAKPPNRRMLAILVSCLAVVGATAAASSAPAGAAPAHRNPRPPVSVAGATLQLTATRSQPPVVTPCRGAPGVVEVRTILTGQASSADPRLAGILTVSARVLVSAAGNGFTTGTAVIRDPVTGRVKVHAQLTQLETAGATKFDGLLMGTVEPGASRLVALYSGRIDLPAGTLDANVGADAPVPPHHTAVIVGGEC
jgi:hypothetical protein